MSKVAAILVAVALAPAALAQDRVLWTDGTSIADVRVNDFTIREVKFARGGQPDAKPADAVAHIQCKRVEEAYKRALGAPTPQERVQQFRLEWEKRVKAKEPFIAQFGLLWEAREHAANADSKESVTECFALLDQLAKDCPESGFLPETYRMKLGYYLSRGEKSAGEAKAVAAKYRHAAESNAWPNGFLLEANYYELMAEVATGSLKAAQFESGLKDLLVKTEGTHPSVANRVKLQLAHQMRLQKRAEDAQRAYQELVDRDGLDDDTRAGALLGIGYLRFESGDPTNREPYKQALLTFLRPYLETPNASAESRAEGVYYAAQACDKWRGPDSASMARRLQGVLKRDFPETSWAKR